MLQKLPPPPNKYDIDSVKNFYKDLNIITKFQLKPTTEDIALELLKNIDISKVAGIDNLSAEKDVWTNTSDLRCLEDVLFTSP